MDVRHFTFLAQQPSAVLQSRDSFCGLSKRSLAFVLANMMFWQPVAVSYTHLTLPTKRIV